MIQNLIALAIVFLATAYTIFSVIKNLTAKKASHCGGCTGCRFNESPMVRQTKAMPTGKSQSKNLML